MFLSWLFLFKNDLVLFIENTLLSFQEDSKNITIKQIKEIEILNHVDMPGALKVVTGILGANNQSENLSKEKIIELTNKYRLENSNLQALKENNKLNLSAEKKLQDMFSKQYFEHISPSGIGVADLSLEANYEYLLVGENLAMGDFKDNASLVEAWIKSKGHRENIINNNYQDIGVAVGQGNYNGQKIWMAVQHFGLSQKACPIIDKNLLNTINLKQNILNEMEANLKLRKEMIARGVMYEGNNYQEQVKIYNSLIDPHNNLLREVKQKIINYNHQVELYNDCLSKYQ